MESLARVTGVPSFRTLLGQVDQTALDRLVSQGFGVSAGASFYDDFPVWDEKHGAPILRIGAHDNAQLICAAGLRIATLKLASPVRVGLIGCVTTDPDWRGHRLASSAVERLCAEAAARGCAAAVLWGSQSALYERIGFRWVGKQVRTPLSALKFEGQRGLKFGSGWNPGLFDLLCQRDGGLQLSSADRAWIEAHRNVQWLWASRAGSPSAYVGLGKGIDLQGIIHEWGGNPESLRSLLSELRAIGPAIQIIGKPEVMRKFELGGHDFPSEPMCMAKALGALAEAEPRVLDELFCQAWFWGLDGA